MSVSTTKSLTIFAGGVEDQNCEPSIVDNIGENAKTPQAKLSSIPSSSASTHTHKKERKKEEESQSKCPSAILLNQLNRL
jgi:type 1 fimbria pilin